MYTNDEWFDDYRSVPAGFTPERFAAWLRKNPTRKLICANENSCALAQWVADELMPKDANYVHVAEGITFTERKHGGIVAGWVLPEWAEQFITDFDEGAFDIQEDGTWSDPLPKIHGKKHRFRTGAETIDVLNHVTGRKFRRPKAA